MHTKQSNGSKRRRRVINYVAQTRLIIESLRIWQAHQHENHITNSVSGSEYWIKNHIKMIETALLKEGSTNHVLSGDERIVNSDKLNIVPLENDSSNQTTDSSESYRLYINKNVSSTDLIHIQKANKTNESKTHRWFRSWSYRQLQTEIKKKVQMRINNIISRNQINKVDTTHPWWCAIERDWRWD